MIKNIVWAVLYLLLHFSVHAQSDTISQRIVLIGDAGQLTGGRHPVVDAVRNLITLDTKTTVLFLGDNLYKFGLPDKKSTSDIQYYKDKAVLDSQLSVTANTEAKLVMIPGNHDWENSKRDGRDAIIRQQEYIDAADNKDHHIDYLPKDGCPGPQLVNLGNDAVLIIFDSQWWIHPYSKPEIESDCKCKTKEELVAQIADLAAKNSKKLILLACHHPFISNGPHGGVFEIKQHIFPFTDFKPSLYIPLPVLGSIYPIVRSMFGTPQDLKHPNYANMISQITNAIKPVAPHVVFVSGHDHNLQHIRQGNYNYIISGGGCKTNRVSKNRKSLFYSRSTGFSVLEISKNKSVRIAFYTVGDTVAKPYDTFLLSFATLPEPEQVIKDREAGNMMGRDTAIAASDKFPVVHGLKKFFVGQNYREEWSKPVAMKVFDIGKEKGGLNISGVGGSKQTLSLRLTDSTGKEWALRKVEKKPALIIPGPFSPDVTADLAKELNSASHPYGALIVPYLAKPLDLTIAHPELFFLPDDPRLKEYRTPDIVNKAYMLEDRLTTLNGRSTQSSSWVIKRMVDENDQRPHQPTVLRARLLDMLIGDFDRHLDQWRWSVTTTDEGKTFYPIPRDRDQAFFYSDGQIMKKLSGRIMPFLKGFRPDIPSVNWLGYTARDFDRIFLNDLDADQWKNAIAHFQQKLNDTVIRNSVKNLPPEIYAIDGEKIIQKLISRRNTMGSKAMTYFDFISKKVNVVGTNQKEYFKVSNFGEGLRVKVYARQRGNDTSLTLYDRVFNPSVTKEIRLFGLNDDDVFDIEENASSRIRIRVVGGGGIDTFDMRGHVVNLLYDRKSDSNFIRHKSRSQNRFSVDQPSESRSFLGFEYNTGSFPQYQGGYDSDDGWFAGISFSNRTQGFRKIPYATDQKFSALYAFRGAYRFDYRGEFNQLIHLTDLVVKARYSSPALKNFFGLGNKTKTEPQKNPDYYRIKYEELEVEALLRRRFLEKLNLSAGPYFYSYQNSYNKNSRNILSLPRLVGLDSANIFSNKMYLGGKFNMTFNNCNNELFPTRGVLWNTDLVAVAGMNKSSNNYAMFGSDMSIYASFREQPKLVAVIRFGGSRILSKHYEYFQAMSLGTDNYLHGFRQNRFAGGSSAFGSFELRIKLFDINSYILPGPFGLTGFCDIGRVWLKNESSNKWHGAYGAGFYFIPFHQFIISGSAGFSQNEKIFNFSLGSKFNLNF